jgi:hypothetical protein
MILIQSNAKLEVSVWQDLIDVINETEKEVEAANQWQPFDYQKVKPDFQHILLTDCDGEIRAFQAINNNDSGDADIDNDWICTVTDTLMSDMPAFYESIGEMENVTYKLIQL